ncbi:MAG: hypothetical protein IJR08_00545 [Bacilli bacterium]|nr:hypothetical protein [Bacilli bacterium]
MKIQWIKTNLTAIQKICLSGLFIAIAVILQKVVAINYLAFAPFVRVSLGGPALVMFGSILLGPIYGLFIGVASDLLGYFIFDASGYPLFLQVTAIYALLGFVSYFVFSLVYSLRNTKALTIIEIAFVSVIWITISLFMLLNNQIKLFSTTYDLTVLSKVLVISISGVIFLSIILLSNLIKPKDGSVFASPLHICFASFICDFFVLVLFGSVMKAWAFGFTTFVAIVICQALVMSFNVFIDTFFISTFQHFCKKYYVSR